MTTLDQDVRDRVRSYLTHQATKQPESIVGVVQQGHDQLMGTIADISDAQAAFAPGPDEWSVLDVLAHVLSSKRGVARICAQLARGEMPGGHGAEGEAPLGLRGKPISTIAEARAALDAGHAELLAFVDSLASAANVEATYKHGFFGALNCREWAVFQRVHDADHAGQIEKIKAATGFPAE